MVEEITDKVSIMSCGSVIQHGHFNDRIYLMKVGKKADSTLPHELQTIAEQNGYSKIFVKIPERYSRLFLNAGYVEEAQIPGFYNGKEAGVFLAYFPDNVRSVEINHDELDNIRNIALSKANDSIKEIDKQFKVKICLKENAVEKDMMYQEMADIYSEVFKTYPFPITNPVYLAKVALQDVVFFGVDFNGKLLALSSAEIDRESSNVEMTDFATIPEWRGKGFGIHLLDKMEIVIKSEGIKTAYTIARAASVGMNTVFARKGYSFGGRLKNNTNISGNIESMNVWYKNL